MEDFCLDCLDWVDIDRRARPQGRYQSCDLCACQSRHFCLLAASPVPRLSSWPKLPPPIQPEPNITQPLSIFDAWPKTSLNWPRSNPVRISGICGHAEGFRFHALSGRDKGRFAVNASGNWRITFGWTEDDATDVDLEDYH